jgi:hypothetical protein
MELVIGILVVVVVYMANKANAVQMAATATNSTTLPAPSASPTSVASATPSPATALGAPGANAQYQVQLDTNSQNPLNGDGMYTVSGTPPGLGGIPQPFVPTNINNGFDANSAATKQLQTVQPGARTRNGRMGIPNGPVYVPPVKL